MHWVQVSPEECRSAITSTPNGVRLKQLLSEDLQDHLMADTDQFELCCAHWSAGDHLAILLSSRHGATELIGIDTESVTLASKELHPFLSSKHLLPSSLWVRNPEVGVLSLPHWKVVRSVELLTAPCTALPKSDEESGAATGVRIRPIVLPDEAEAVLEINAAAFANHPTQGSLLPDQFLQLQHTPWFDPRGLLVAVDETSMLGFCWTKLHQSAAEPHHAGDGEIFVIAVSPRAHRTGLGGKLLQSGLGYLAERGATRWTLWVEAENVAAKKMYSKYGFRRECSRHSYRIHA